MAEKKTIQHPVRLAAKRQITLPASVVTQAGLEQGDELLVIMHGPSDIRLVPCARIRRDLITPEIDAILKQRRAEIDEGTEMVSQQIVLKRAKTRNAERFARAAQDVAAEATAQG